MFSDLMILCLPVVTKSNNYIMLLKKINTSGCWATVKILFSLEWFSKPSSFAYEMCTLRMATTPPESALEGVSKYRCSVIFSLKCVLLCGHLTCVARLSTCCTSSWVSVGFFKNNFTIAVSNCNCTWEGSMKKNLTQGQIL